MSQATTVIASEPEADASATVPIRSWAGPLELVLLLLAVAAAVGHRLQLAWSTDFPINDGALFVAYVQATSRELPGLPTVVSYNGELLPYAYPPLGFLVGGLLNRLGFDAIDVVHVLPPLLNALWIVLLAMLFLRDGRSRLFTAAAVGILAVNFRSYEWLAMGGGLTRGLGAVFLVLTLLALGGTRGREPAPLTVQRAVLAGLCVGAAVLSHLEWGLLAAACLVVQRVLRSQTVGNAVLTTVAAGVAALVLVLPWVLLVVSQHGLEPFLAASETSTWNFAAGRATIEGYARAQWPNLLMAVGGAVLVARRGLFWLVFIVLCLLLTPRHAPTPLVLPMSYLTAQGLGAVVLVVRRAWSEWRDPALLGAVSALALIAFGVSGLVVDRTRPVSPAFAPVSAEVREAMTWVSDEHAGARFAVVTDPPWWLDASAEWFPLLADATSSTTVQGTEWLPAGTFQRRQETVMAMKASPTCQDLVTRALNLQPVQFVWTQTRPQCFRAAGMPVVYRNAEVTVFAVR